MTHQYSKLAGKIVESYGTQYNFAIAMGVSERTLSLKMNGKRRWTSDDIEKSIELLGIPCEEIHLYFFDNKVRDCRTKAHPVS